MPRVVQLSPSQVMNMRLLTISLASVVPISAALPEISLSATRNETGTAIVLTWSGGKPSYQLQRRATLDASWTNIGIPSSFATALIEPSDQAGFYRVVQDYTAQYRATFNATWSSSTHPAAFPGGAHWSGLVGGVHDDRVHFWREGETASLGIQNMAERGIQSTLVSEINPAITAGNARFTLTGGGIGGSPGSVSLTFPQSMRRDFPLVTLVSMIAPSPDWFVGVDSLSLIENDEWVFTKTVTLYGFDAGTDSGASYSSPDLVTTPRGIITRFTAFLRSLTARSFPLGHSPSPGSTDGSQRAS